MDTNENQENKSISEDEVYIDQQVGIPTSQGMINCEDAQSSINGLQGRAIHYAGFWMRFWAYLLDLIVIGSIERIFIKPIFRIFDIPLWEIHMLTPISIADALVFYLYFILMTKFLGQTLGKMVFGLKVMELKNNQLTWGTVLFREWIGRFISATIIIGYIMVGFLSKKQGLHDLFADTTVVHLERQ